MGNNIKFLIRYICNIKISSFLTAAISFYTIKMTCVKKNHFTY
jgi:hypothetical protein